jgi:eukaryotic-like serine/threonine-protein kinase
MERQDSTMLGRYKLLALLATGGMAEIYVARQVGIHGFERLVVVKKILPNLARDKRFLDMFFDEARIAAQLNHPNIVQIYDLGQEGDSYFIAMEYLEGESLGYLVTQSRKTGIHLPADLAAGIIVQVCDGLDYAHKLCDDTGKPLHIVHRDVSPQNIIVLFSGGVKIVDFGIAKATSQMHLTQVGTLKGKVSYMSPEQCMGQPVNAASDVFSLGIVFWEILARRRLFKQENEVTTLQSIVYDEVPAVSSIRPEVPKGLSDIIDCALQKNPANRYKNASEMATAIRGYLRQTGAAAGVQEIASFVDRVFADRARTKRRLLEEIRRADKTDDKQISLELLKPDSYVSIPIGTADVVADEDGETIAPIESKKMTFAERMKKWLGTAIWVAPPAVLCIGLLLWWWAPGSRSSENREAGGAEGDRQTAEESNVLAFVDAGVEVEPDAGGQEDGTEPPLFPSMVSIHSEPTGCKIEVDGIEISDPTPLDNLPLDPDMEHAVVVACRKHEKERKLITLKPHEQATLEFLLAPVKEATRPEIGFLWLNTEPWSRVFLDGRDLGITPLEGIRLSPGSYKLTAVNEELKIKKTIQVSIQTGKKTSIYKNLSE